MFGTAESAMFKVVLFEQPTKREINWLRIESWNWKIYRRKTNIYVVICYASWNDTGNYFLDVFSQDRRVCVCE